MGVIGKVESLWRYPVKSMRGEELEKAYVGFPGIYGDRLLAFKSSASPEGFPYLTGREQEQMLRYRPRFREPATAAEPPNLGEAEKIGSGVTPVYPDPAGLAVDVETPGGEVLAVNSPALIEMLRAGVKDAPEIKLLRSDRSMTDCRPVSLFSIQTARQLADEVGIEIDKRRFRANIYVDLESGAGFGEDAAIGRSVRIGSKAVISILERDSRCKMVSLDPDTAETDKTILKHVAKAHEGKAGVYGAVLVEGTIRPGDAIELLD